MNSAVAPQRTCVGCRAKRPQTDLVRLALTTDGQPIISRTASGRGAWMCAPPTPGLKTSCLRQAIKRRGFERAWKRTIPTSTHQAIEIAFEALAASAVKTNMEN